MTHPAIPERDLVSTLLAALAGGPIHIGHRDLGNLASSYRPDDGAIELNPAATAAEQSLGLVEALEAMVALDDHPAFRPRPRLRLLQGGGA